MVIFNVEIWQKDADNLMALSCADKKKWIKTHTNQQNDTLIEEFLKSVNRGNDEECHGCKQAKNEQPKGNAETIAAATEPIDATSDGKGGNRKGGNKPTRNQGG